MTVIVRDLHAGDPADSEAFARIRRAASGLPTTDPEAAAAAAKALDELELLAREGDFEALLA